MKTQSVPQPQAEQREGSVTPRLRCLRQYERLECGPSGNTARKTTCGIVVPFIDYVGQKATTENFFPPSDIQRRSAIEGILVWFGNITAQGHKVMEKTGKTTSKITDMGTSC